jgi:dipeptidyl aminopeptidase/acylaminoacyl peptidase
MFRSLLIYCLLTISMVTVSGCGPGGDQGAVPLIPMKDFFRHSEQSSYSLSPDGEHLAFLQPHGDRLNIFVKNIESDRSWRVTEAVQRDIHHYYWAGNRHLVYLQDRLGDENWHIWAVNLTGDKPRDLTPFDGVRAMIVDDLKNIDGEIIISMNRRDRQVFDLYRLNLDSGELEMIAENPGDISYWMTDHQGRLRLAVATDGVQTSILYRAGENEPFNKVLTTSFRERIKPLLFTADNSRVYVSSNLGRDRAAIFIWNPRSGEHEELIFEHDEVDAQSVTYSQARGALTGVVYTTDRKQYHFFDGQREALQRVLEEKLPDRDVFVIDFSRDEKRCLVRTVADRSHGSYYYYDSETDHLKLLVELSPWLDQKQLSPMRPISYRSRDGLLIRGYLTLPLGVDETDLPVVVHPHGGPWTRNIWGFDPEVQFLANRGYAVLQMNFRGSTGYGREFWEAGFKEWGQGIQDDITDGVRWLIDRGTADPERVAIYGGSFGGYAALAGLAFTPDLYTCGVDFAGFADIIEFLDAIPPYWEPFREMMYEMVGNPETDLEMLRAASPANHVDRIRAPLLVAQGANDPRVSRQGSDRLVAAMREQGLEVQYMLKEDEGHGFVREENLFDFFHEVELFLGRHLGGRVESDPSSSR